MSSRRSGRAGVSRFWPTPARATDHFTEAQLARSAKAHAPAWRRRRRVTTGRVALLVIAALVLSPASGEGNVGSSAVLPVVAVAVALWLPYLLAVGPPTETPSVATAIVFGLVLPLVIVAVDAVVPRLLDWAMDPAWSWSMVVTVVVLRTAAEILAIRQPASPYELERVPSRWHDLVQKSGIEGPVAFTRLTSTAASGAVTARCTGIGPGRRIEVSRAALDRLSGRPGVAAGVVSASRADQTAEVHLADFVVAHEIQHLARHHVAVNLALGAVMVGGSAATVALLASTGMPWALLGAEPTEPGMLPVTVLVAWAALAVLSIPVAWIRRALERVADDGAIDLVGLPPDDDLKQLFGQSEVWLHPPRRVRLLALHPSPVERLEFFKRRR